MQGLPEHLKGLLLPDAYPHAVGKIEVVETHISWVILTGEIAYKIKRPVRYAFIDLSSAERREFFCREELRLNRRFAAELYLNVCEIRRHESGARIGGTGPLLEYAVCMRQFRGEDELERLLQAGRIEPSELEAFGRTLAEVHARLPGASSDQPWGRPDTVRRLVLENLQQCRTVGPTLPGELLDGLRESLDARLAALAARMDARVAGGFVRECHGDLHMRNIVRHGERLLAFDCLEYEAAFRWIDVADEIAFLSADLEAHGHTRHDHAFVNAYLARSGDYEACRLLDLYRAHRALIRAKVTALNAAGEDARRRCRDYVATARTVLAPRQPQLILMCGLSGSGKSFLAMRLAPALRAIHIRSDVERKRLAGLAATARSASSLEQGLYSRATSEAVYEHLSRAAEHALAGGYPVIVDATFIRRDERTRFRSLAERLQVELRVIRCTAPPDVLRQRIAARGARGLDPSEADVAVLQWQQAHVEAITPDEGLRLIEIDTAADLGAEAQVRTLMSFFTAVTPGADQAVR